MTSFFVISNSRLICGLKCTKLEISIFVTIHILDEVSDQGVATYKRIYGDWTDISKKSWKEQLLRYSINPIQQYSNTNGKNSTDSAMIIDAMDILYSGNVEGFCLVSSDSDFTKLAQRLRESGMFVLGMGEQKTPSSFRVACDAFKILEIISQNEDDISPAITAVSENPARYGTSQDETPSITSKAEIERTVSRVLTENNDHGKNTTLSEIGSILQKKFSEFDVRNYGYSKRQTLRISSAGSDLLQRRPYRQPQHYSRCPAEPFPGLRCEAVWV